MPKAEPFQDLSLLPPANGQELWKWLYHQIRNSILDGRLKRGSRLPSTRSLAQQHGVSRGTVVAAYEQLRSEGYIQGESGSGTFVAPETPDNSIAARRRPAAPAVQPPTAALSKRAMQMIEGVRLLPESRVTGRAFRNYEPAIDLFPVNLWSRVAGRVMRRAPRSLYAQGNVAGYEPLRRAIAEYVGTARGVRCDAQQVLITVGAQQALDLVSRMLLDPGDRVWLEDPGYPGAHSVFRAAGARVVPVPVDADGLDVSAARKLAPSARLAYVTPSNQFPTGVALSLDRRMALLEWAARAGAWIIEDEYDAEYRYFGRPAPAMQSLDRAGSVIYVGTFTKMLFNALRLGFVVVPERIVDPFLAARSFFDRHPSTLGQAVLAEFIFEGHFGHHVRRMRQAYAERLQTLREAAKQHLGGAIDVVEAAAGMRTLAWLPESASDIETAQRGRALGLELSALSEFSVRHARPPALVLGFAGCAPAELRRGVRVLAAALNVKGT